MSSCVTWKKQKRLEVKMIKVFVAVILGVIVIYLLDRALDGDFGDDCN